MTSNPLPSATPIIFMGTPDFAVPALRALLQAGYPIQAVYSQPPRPKGRGHQLQKSPVQLCAEQHQLPVYTPTRLDEKAVQILHELSPHLIIVAAYGLLLPKAVLDIPPLGCLNIHASLLPRWRGAAPIQRAILEGDTSTGITIMRMDEGMDTGAMVDQSSMPITSATTAFQLTQELATSGANFLCEILPAYIGGRYTLTPQPPEGVRYAPKVKSSDGQLYWREAATVLERRVRAINSWFLFEGKRFKVNAAEALNTHSSQPPGIILDNRLLIACGEGSALRPLTLTPEGSKTMELDAFLHGHGHHFSAGKDIS